MRRDAIGPQEWETPDPLFDTLHDEYGFTLDAAATCENAKLPVFFTEAHDGLRRSWAGHRVWCNPPFKRGGDWVAKAREEQRERGVFSALLVLASVETTWFHDVALTAQVWLFRGRIRFVPPPGVVASQNTQANILVVFDPRSSVRGIVGTRCARTGEVLRDLRRAAA
jgi:phage N-6-adenine-methyltransferase